MARNAGPAQVDASPLLLERTRLVDAVRSTPDAGVCVLMSSAGYGRRTVLRQAVDGHAVRLRLGPRHGSVVRWRTSLLALLASPPVAGRDPSAEDLLDALTASDTPWLVIEDVDVRMHADVLHDIRLLTVDCPDGHRIALTSTSDLGTAVAEARLAGRLVEIDQPDLALTREEGHALLALLAPTLGGAVAEQLVALCDGWAAALAAVIRRQALDPTDDVVTWLRTRGAEQMVGPWLDALPEDARDMLLDTAIVPVLHPGLVDAISPGREASSWLVRMTRDRGPVRTAKAPAPGGSLGYERHPLLTELLLRQSAGRREDQQRHLRAAGWYRAHGDLGGELENLLAAGRNDQAAERLFAHEDELFTTGRAEDVLRWYDNVPDDPIGGGVDDILRRGWASALTGDIAGGYAALGRVRLLMTRSGTDGSHLAPAGLDLEGEAAVLEARLAYNQGDARGMLEAAVRARRRFAEDWSRNSHQIAAMFEAQGHLLLGRPDRAEETLASVRELPFALAAIGEGIRGEVEAEVAWSRGAVFESRAWSARQNRWLAGQGDGPVLEQFGPSVAYWLCEAEADNLDDALAGLEAAVGRASTHTGIAIDHVVALLGLARVHRLRGDARAALSSVTTARSVVQQRSPAGGLLGPVSMSEARIRLAAGDGLRAERLLRGLPRTNEALLLQVRLHLLRGGPAAAQFLREFEPATPRDEVEHAVLSAWAQVSTSPQRAEQHLIRAADISAAQGMTTTLVDVPESVLDLARRTATYFVHDDLVHLVLVSEQARRGHRSAAPDAGTAELLLGRGDLQMLALLPSRASNTRIADELGISVNTVKTRLRRLYAKLDVHGRDAAIARAAELGLIAGRRPRP